MVPWNKTKIPLRGVFVIDPCERVRANENEGYFQLGLGHMVTWGVGESGMVLFRYGDGVQQVLWERWGNREKMARISVGGS
uniref:Uncharacterized protein n=1 Tax=Tanacetum cinerariifolium TaxID=118510 RepID=A0A699JU65_TANCI|nr:hypothetical protein [Tanacetum cinerariifolium]GFA54894.1 hypothetical protein [Tanacetum cinerariifolium]